jgi:hypothetical protein
MLQNHHIHKSIVLAALIRISSDYREPTFLIWELSMLKIIPVVKMVGTDIGCGSPMVPITHLEE